MIGALQFETPSSDCSSPGHLLRARPKASTLFKTQRNLPDERKSAFHLNNTFVQTHVKDERKSVNRYYIKTRKTTWSLIIQFSENLPPFSLSIRCYPVLQTFFFTLFRLIYCYVRLSLPIRRFQYAPFSSCCFIPLNLHIRSNFINGFLTDFPETSFVQTPCTYSFPVTEQYPAIIFHTYCLITQQNEFDDSKRNSTVLLADILNLTHYVTGFRKGSNGQADEVLL